MNTSRKNKPHPPVPVLVADSQEPSVSPQRDAVLPSPALNLVPALNSSSDQDVTSGSSSSGEHDRVRQSALVFNAGALTFFCNGIASMLGFQKTTTVPHNVSWRAEAKECAAILFNCADVLEEKLGVRDARGGGLAARGTEAPVSSGTKRRASSGLALALGAQLESILQQGDPLAVCIRQLHKHKKVSSTTPMSCSAVMSEPLQAHGGNQASVGVGDLVWCQYEDSQGKRRDSKDLREGAFVVASVCNQTKALKGMWAWTLEDLLLAADRGKSIVTGPASCSATGGKGETKPVAAKKKMKTEKTAQDNNHLRNIFDTKVGCWLSVASAAHRMDQL